MERPRGPEAVQLRFDDDLGFPAAVDLGMSHSRYPAQVFLDDLFAGEAQGHRVQGAEEAHHHHRRLGRIIFHQLRGPGVLGELGLELLEALPDLLHDEIHVGPHLEGQPEFRLSLPGIGPEAHQIIQGSQGGFDGLAQGLLNLRGAVASQAGGDRDHRVGDLGHQIDGQKGKGDQAQQE